MSIAIEETREYLQEYAESLANLVDSKDDNEEHAAFMLQAVDALDLLEESLAEATRLNEGWEEANRERAMLVDKVKTDRDEVEAELNAKRIEAEQGYEDLQVTVKHFVRRFNNIAHEMEQLRQDVG